MKFSGKKISEPTPVVIAIPRDDGDLIFIAKAVLDYKVFDQICPEPKPGIITYPGGGKKMDNDSPQFLDKKRDYSARRYYWMLITSLKDTPNLEWEIVDPSNPDTWDKFEEELRASNLTQHESNSIISGIMQVNTVDEAKMQEARARFLQMQQAQVPTS